MDKVKSINVKYGDSEALLEGIKKIMETYDMYLVESAGSKYVFDRDGSYSRAFIVNPPVNGWITMVDEDEMQAETLSQELSEILECLIICGGIDSDVLYYSAYRNGEQADQYMSSFENYEYPVNDNVINTYRGNASALGEALEPGDAAKLQEVLDRCKDMSMDPWDGYEAIRLILGMIPKEYGTVTEQTEDEAGKIEGVFFVDYESINIRTDNRAAIIDAIERIAGEMGYGKVSEFGGSDGEKRGLFKKIFSAISEKRQMSFYISPFREGWVTMVGEIRIQYGSEEESEFLHIEDRLSKILETQIVNIYAGNENWGIKVFEDGEVTAHYTSDDEDGSDVINALMGAGQDELKAVLGKPIHTIDDIDETFSQFCSALGIRNYRVNTPMDYSEDEFRENILDKLPDGEGFENFKFELSK